MARQRINAAAGCLIMLVCVRVGAKKNDYVGGVVDPPRRHDYFSAEAVAEIAETAAKIHDSGFLLACFLLLFQRVQQGRRLGECPARAEGAKPPLSKRLLVLRQQRRLKAFI